MKNNRAFLPAILFSALLLLFSCSGDGDKRKDVKEEYGEPDDIITGGWGGIKVERYIYRNSEINRVYEFRKSASGCGGSSQWYIDRVYYADYLGYILYSPPIITHTPVETSPPGQKILVVAEVTDDITVQKVTLYYRKSGQEEFIAAIMSVDESKENTYNSEIPADTVSSDGVEYYIEAEDDEGYTSLLPKDGVYTIAVSATAKTISKASTPSTSGTHSLHSPLPEPGSVPHNLSPVSP